MDGETVTSIAALAQRAEEAELTKSVELNGTTFTYRQSATEHGRVLGEVLTPPRPNILTVTTLTGLVDAIQNMTMTPNDFLVHVEDYLTVSLKERGIDQWGQRATHITAKHAPLNAFTFDQYYSDLPKFIIGLQAAFLQTEELLYLIRLASNLKAGNSVHAEDDGFSQSITVRTGEIGTAEIKVKPRIKLIPLRSFPEAAPVESEFLIRFQQSEKQAPSIALFDVGGGAWKGLSMQAIKTWLIGQVNPGLPIIA